MCTYFSPCTTIIACITLTSLNSQVDIKHKGVPEKLDRKFTISELLLFISLIATKRGCTKESVAGEAKRQRKVDKNHHQFMTEILCLRSPCLQCHKLSYYKQDCPKGSRIPSTMQDMC